MKAETREGRGDDGWLGLAWLGLAGDDMNETMMDDCIVVHGGW